MQRQPLDIYAGELIEITRSCKADLARLIETAGNVYIYAANGHGAWEAALVNTLSPGDRVLVLESGRFAIDWGKMAGDLGLQVSHLPGGWRHAVAPAEVERQLRADSRHEIKAVLTTQIDTASGVANDISAIAGAIAAAGHPALFMVDVIGSLASVPFSMDAWGIDVSVAGSQKGLMCPPGLSFVAAGPRALDAHSRSNAPRHYWDWTGRNQPMHYFQYCGTPPEHLLFALRAALDMIFEEGVPSVFERHRLLAGAVRAATGVWASSPGSAVTFNVIDPAARADSVTTLLTAEGHDPSVLHNHCRDVFGLVLGIGIGELRGKAFRIAHMGHINAPMILGALATVELAMTSLGWSFGAGGVQAAIDHLARRTRPQAQ
jgi:alanine-glyoxylate transaminase/serine-glyoxylate transaminase/serine-pyruvate transaminase